MYEFQVAKTRFGNVKYITIGPTQGELVLFSTGGGAGCNLVYAFVWLAQAGFRVVAINRPGYYDLPVDTVDSIREHADIYYEVMKSLGITDEVHVFGLSMGGLSALYYAQNYPTKSLVLWSAVTGPYQVNQASARSPLGKMVLSKTGKRLTSWMLLTSVRLFPQATAESFLKAEADMPKQQRKVLAKQVVGDPTSKRELLVFIKSMTPMSALYVGMMDEVEKAVNLTVVDWSTITCPTLAIHSTVDKDVSLDHPKRLERMMPHAKVSYVRAGGHFVWWGEEGLQVKRQTLDFLKSGN